MSQMRHFLNDTSYNYKWGLIPTLTHSLRTRASFRKQYQKHNFYSNLSFHWASICIPLKCSVMLTDKEERGRLKESRPKMYMREKIWKLFLGFILFKKSLRGELELERFKLHMRLQVKKKGQHHKHLP